MSVDLLIRDSEVSQALRELGSGFAADVADVIKQGRPGNLYDAVVSSQFDADRLDYLQRDRLMTGVHNSCIDFLWLIANLEIGTVKTGVDEQPVGEVETFVLGPKAHHAAETYVLALFQLYPTIYFHKATRSAEKVFSALMGHVIQLFRDGHEDKIGLPANHPLIRFAKDPRFVAERSRARRHRLLGGAADDAGGWRPPNCRLCGGRLRERRLPKCIDIRARLEATLVPTRPTKPEDVDALRMRLKRLVDMIDDNLQAWSAEHSKATSRILVDQAERHPYRRFDESKGPLNQIRIRTGDGRILDMAECSPVVTGLEKFALFRAYVDEDDHKAKAAIEDIVTTALGRNEDAEP